MKRLLLATVALSLLAAPAAFAQPQDYHHKRPQQTHVVKKKVVTKKVVTRRDWKRGHRLPHQLRHQPCMRRLAAHGRAVLAIERHVKHADTEFRRHLGLQLQALAHACLTPL